MEGLRLKFHIVKLTILNFVFFMFLLFFRIRNYNHNKITNRLYQVQIFHQFILYIITLNSLFLLNNFYIKQTLGPADKTTGT